MGFMGFGMQKWIYTMRPRKPFTMNRRVSFTVIPTYKREFKLQPSKNHLKFYFGIVFAILIAIVLTSWIPKWLEYARIRNEQEITFTIKKNNEIFEFLLKSGKKRLYHGQISGAYSEFKLAYKIRPNDEKLNQLLLETLEILCLEYGRSCNNYSKIKNKLEL